MGKYVIPIEYLQYYHKATAIKLYVSGHRPHQFWELSRKIIIILRMRNCAIVQCL